MGQHFIFIRNTYTGKPSNIRSEKGTTKGWRWVGRGKENPGSSVANSAGRRRERGR